ncbi:hypothetical protein A3860_05240 [Niastella vici]|uniref:Peptidase M16 n=1 Tax=Niastella vici TaxID=1703345 RepID=A0A1V9FRY8_9BACT|nr:insulinase family protein [Niastella vici]OQP61124.1 hypothetical protein A3860_05240 [Niastella vici]
MFKNSLLITVRKIAVIFIVELITPCLFAQPGSGKIELTGGKGQVNSGTLIPPDPNVKIGRLPNGFTYYIRKNIQPANRAVFYLVNKVGSVLETDDQRGLAHFLEHMAFNGTKHFPQNELINYLEKSGVRFGADINASTGFDETIYKLPVPVENKEVLRNTIQILRDWAQDVTLDDKEIDKERGVVLEEKRQRLGASQRIQEKTFPVIGNDSRYVNRLPIGTEDVLKNFNHELLRKFYISWYRPNLQALIVTGDIDVKEIEKMIVAKFSDLKNPSSAPERTEYTVPLLNKNQFLSVTDAETPATSINISIKHQAAEMKTEADLRESMLRFLFNGILNARFTELARLENAPFQTINCNLSGLIGNLEALNFSVQPKPGEMEKAFKALWIEAERIKRFGFLPSELEIAKINFLSRYESLYKERDKLTSEQYVNQYVQHFLKGTAIPTIEYMYDFYKKNIGAITVNDLSNLFIRCFKDTNRDILITANDKDKASIPAEDLLLQWMREVEKDTMTAYVDKPVGNTLMITQPVPGKITSEKKAYGKTGITEILLSNGIRVLLKPTDFRNDEILWIGTSPGGSSLVSDSDFHAISLASSVIAGSGVGSFNTLALQRMLAGKKMNVTPGIGPYTEGVNGSASPKDLETALQLQYLYFTNPGRDPVSFNLLKEQLKAGYENSRNLPDNVFSDTITSVSSGYHFRSQRVTPAEIDNIQLDKVMALYKDRFGDAGDFTFVFVGNFKVEEIKPLLEKYLGSLPSRGRIEKAKDIKQDIPQGTQSRKVFKGKEPQAKVVLMLSGKYTPDAVTNFKLNVLTNILRLRLIQRLREDIGGIYSVNINASLRSVPTGEYAFDISFICDPKNVELLILTTFSEINKIKLEGPLQDDIDKIKAQAKVVRPRSLRTNEYWLSVINGAVQHGTEELLEDIFSDKQWKEITTESLKDAAMKYLRGENYMRFVLLPEQ